MTVNSGSALVLGCLAKAFARNPGTLDVPAFVLSKGSAPTLTTTAATSAENGDTAAAATPGVAFTLKPTGGTLIWDNINGNYAGYDYVISVANFGLTNTVSPVTGYAQFYIPSLALSDAGLYYCTFYDATGKAAEATATVASNYANSGFFSLTITTKSGSGSSKSAQRNKAFEYSIALLGASKMLF